MLKIFRRLNEIDLAQLLTVYEESITRKGRELLPWGTEYEQIGSAQQDFYEYLNEFFCQREAFYAVWTELGQYQSALRMEPYRDGYLLCGLETTPKNRSKGFASALISAVQEFLSAKTDTKVYAHIDKQNKASLAVHTSCGFQRIADYAVYLDGSVFQSSYTLLWRNTENAT